MHVLAVIPTPKCLENKNAVEYPYLTGVKRFELLIIDTQMV